MKTITTEEAEAHLSQYLTEVEKGEEFLIARGHDPVAKLVPVARANLHRRPMVGEIEGETFEFPVSAFESMSPAELREWGL